MFKVVTHNYQKLYTIIAIGLIIQNLTCLGISLVLDMGCFYSLQHLEQPVEEYRHSRRVREFRCLYRFLPLIAGAQPQTWLFIAPEGISFQKKKIFSQNSQILTQSAN
jgi:hypothetical protein